MANLKRILKRIPGGYDLSCLLNSPAEEIRNWMEYSRLKKMFRSEKHDKSATKKKLLVISLMGNMTSGVKIEMLLAKSAEFAGLEPIVLTNRWTWANRFYRALGMSSFVYFSDFLDAAKKETDLSDVKKVADGIKTFDDLMGYTYKGVNTGKYICSSLVRKTYTGNVDMNNPETRRMLEDYLVSTSINAVAAQKIYDKYKPDAVLFLERGYTPYGEFFDIALKRNLKVIQWCGSHRNDSLTLKKYNGSNQDQHPASLSRETWDYLKNMPWDKNKADAIKNELFKNYSSGEWFAEVGTQFKAKMMESEAIKKQLGLDPSKKTAVIFPHLFWDATFFWGEDIFENYREWFVEAVRAACKNKNVNWIIKMHPANVVKLNRDGYKGELVEKTSIREFIGKLPPHIKTLEPDTNISTFSLYKAMDYCLTVRGTVGIESAIFGIPVLTAGTGRYDGYGFTIDSSSREDYLSKLAKIETYSRLSAQQVELAQKFAYGTFILRPFKLSSINVSYRKDKKATQHVEYTVNSIKNLKNAPDVRAFSKWISETKNDDFLRAEI